MASSHIYNTNRSTAEDVATQGFDFESFNLPVHGKDYDFQDFPLSDRKYSMETIALTSTNANTNTFVQEMGASMGCSFNSFSDLSSYSCLFSYEA